uniref:Uncharacterized protein n=1 Tax=Ciona savignyi TaxID=51511 RepID=H2Z913_CIOSA
LMHCLFKCRYPHCHVPEATPPPPNNCLNNPCGTGGSCVSMTAGYRCDCKFGYTGRNCEIKVKTNNCENHHGTYCNTRINNCDNNQCTSGSTCVALTSGYRCNCSPGYTGTYCSTNNCANNPCVFGTGIYCNTRINNCDNNQCKSDSTCVALTSGYRCDCEVGYSGRNCNIKVKTNNCENHQCSLGSTCVALSTDSNISLHRCECNTGYSGTYCNTRINNCDINQCTSGSTCVSLTSGYRIHWYILCECNTGYSGTYCNTRINNCDNNQCKSGRTCVSLTSGYRCQCNAGYSGTYCNTRINNCDNNQCTSGSTCVALTKRFYYHNLHRCECNTGYSGTYCNTRINNCDNNQCKSGSTCVALTSGYRLHRCECNTGYSGTYCNTRINNCDNNQCKSGSTCVSLTSGYRCECNAGYSGTYCTTPINPCDNNRCDSGSTCVALTSGYRNAQCQLYFLHHRCECNAGYSGTYCTTLINPCDNNRCDSGSTCVALTSGYRCQCNTGYSGTYCNTRINNCDNNQCASGSTCVNLSVGYRCDCTPTMTGVYCENKVCNLQCLNGGTCTENKLGQACSPNPCVNGCNCVASCMHEGGYYCLDPTMQFTGRNCNNPVPRLECRYDRIVLTLESGFLQDFDKMEGDSYLYASQSFDDNQRLTECRARMNGNTYTVAIPFPFTSCGTIQTTSTTVAGELHKFNNKLWLNKQSNLPYDMPYPVAEFTCSYGYEYDFVTSLRPTVEPLRNEITTTEMFNATVSLCKTGACDQRCPSTYAVAEQAIYTVGEVVHVRFDIDYLRSSTGNKLVVSIDHLFLSCTKDGFSNEPHVDLLYAGCEMSEAFLKPNAGSILKPGSACFSFMVPRLKECEVIYIHATLRAC